MTPGRGRPSQGLTARYEIRFTPEEKARYQACADAAGIEFSDWIRQSLTEVADRDSKPVRRKRRKSD